MPQMFLLYLALPWIKWRDRWQVRKLHFPLCLILPFMVFASGFFLVDARLPDWTFLACFYVSLFGVTCEIVLLVSAGVVALYSLLTRGRRVRN